MCVLTSGRARGCKDAIGGLKAIFVFNFVEDSFTVTGGQATAISANVVDDAVYKYDLIGTGNSYVETFTASTENGTTVYEQVLTVQLPKQDLATTNQLHLLVKSRAVVVVLDRAGNYRVMGISDGTNGNGSLESGAAKADFNGYNLTLTATEKDPSPFLDSTTRDAFLDLVNTAQITS